MVSNKAFLDALEVTVVADDVSYDHANKFMSLKYDLVKNKMSDEGQVSLCGLNCGSYHHPH